MFNSSLKEECGLKDIPADFRDTNVTKVIRVLYSDARSFVNVVVTTNICKLENCGSIDIGL